ncbi:type II toxin-antitoxin system ParD family antitoxin [Asticcacaulis sp. EMRT-3]|uniref:type II toxin-antitoxin system ParD family antitoxin n=1 Tax=Asticcacaulis sp. EMRT-3 TaxID=3040349 RepID=UPI0024AF8719|nr:type II toxin-antitoxin system ParD family antitoxin [Asticcacaulis sp. EMRT-3]MDI7774740.1 type II toxin-antitoxin system ParD family antitoxin [Asticcacaulis sp. EMRT-3]
MTINFQLGGHSEEFVQGQLSSGRYTDATEVVRDALRIMEERDQAKAEIRAKIAAGMASARAGRLRDGEAAMAELMSDLGDEA